MVFAVFECVFVLEERELEKGKRSERKLKIMDSN